MSILIKGGRVITAADDYVADVFIDGERIALIGESLDRESLELHADRVIDARGKYVDDPQIYRAYGMELLGPPLSVK